MRKKIALVGAGNIGGTLAHLALIKGLGDVVLFDIAEGIPQGKALDLMQSSPIIDSDISIIGSNDYASLKDADAVVVTAGVARKPGMSRDDLLSINAKVMRSVGENIKTYCPNAFVVCVTNPLDVMVNLLAQASGIRDNMILGMAGVLDSARFRLFLAQELNVSVSQVNAYVLGGHGDTMVPLSALSNVAGVSLDQLVATNKLSADRLDQIIKRTRGGGGEIVNLLKTGSAFYAPATAAIQMVESYLLDRKMILPAAAKVTNKAYGISEPLFVGVPVKIGAKGAEEIIEVKLTESEQAGLNKSIQAVIELNEAVANLNIN